MTEPLSMNSRSAAAVADLLRNPFMTLVELERLIEEIQDVAEQRLEGACKRMRVSLRGLDEARIGEALRRVVDDPRATPSDRQAYELMRACIEARFGDWGPYNRDRIILAFGGLEADFLAWGKKHSAAQSDRRKGKPLNDPDDATRNARIYRRLAQLNGEHDATSTVATEFGLSTRQVRRIGKRE